MLSDGSSGANRAPNSPPTAAQPGQTVCLGLLLGVQSGSEDDPNRKSLLTRADEAVTDLFRTYLAKFESTEEVVNAYKK